MIWSLPSSENLLAALVAAIVAGLARGFSGFGGALIFIPLASASLGPRLAAPVLMLVDTIAASGLIAPAWREADRSDVGALAVGALFGAPAGAWVLLHLDPIVLRWTFCALAGAMLLLLSSGWRYRGRPALPVSLAAGAVSGLLSGAAQMGGPPVVAYWLGAPASIARVRANIVLFFAASDLINAVVYLVGGLLTSNVVVLTGLIGPAYALGLFCGNRLFGRASPTIFRRICFLLIGLAAVLGLPLWR